MLKTMSMVLIAAGFAFGGFGLAAYQTKKTAVIADVLLMITVIETQLRYICLPVSDLLRTLCDNSRLENLCFLKKCKDRVDNGEPFPQAWKESVENENELCRLLSGHCSYLLRLGADIGSTDIQGQLSCCEYYKDIFAKELKEREENGKKYSRLYPTIGLMLGVSAAILII